MRIFGERVLPGLMVVAMLLAPGLGHAKSKGVEVYKIQKEKVIKELKLSPEKAKEFRQLDEKYRKERIAILENLKKDSDALKQVLAAKNPVESKVKELVKNVNSLEDKLLLSFKTQREGELALLNPIQQGKYLLGVGPLAP